MRFPCSAPSSAVPVPERCVADCGHKSCTKDHGNPSVKGIDGASVLALNDEHATIALPAVSTISIGDRIELLPSHIDPTMNLHDVVYALDGDKVVGVWPIAARGYAEHRRTDLCLDPEIQRPDARNANHEGPRRLRFGCAANGTCSRPRIKTTKMHA